MKYFNRCVLRIEQQDDKVLPDFGDGNIMIRNRLEIREFEEKENICCAYEISLLTYICIHVLALSGRRHVAGTADDFSCG